MHAEDDSVPEGLRGWLPSVLSCMGSDVFGTTVNPQPPDRHG